MTPTREGRVQIKETARARKMNREKNKTVPNRHDIKAGIKKTEMYAASQPNSKTNVYRNKSTPDVCKQASSQLIKNQLRTKQGMGKCSSA